MVRSSFDIHAGLINSLMFTGESIAIRILEPNKKPGEVGSRFNTFVAGSAGGLLACTVLVPSEVIKCALQTSSLQMNGAEAAANLKKGAFQQTTDTIKLIIRTEGYMGFYKGFAATAIRDIPAIGSYFFIYKNARDLFSKMEQKNVKVEPGQPVVPHQPSSLATIMAGGAAGTLSWAVIYPLDVIKTITQVSTVPVNGNLKSYKDMPAWEVGFSHLKQHGVRGFYRGLAPTLLRAFPVNASTFFFYEKFKLMLEA